MLTNQIKNPKSFLGAAGQLFVMSEFLFRGYNVAIPIVDVGDDVLVVNDGEKTLFRVQVKTSNVSKGQNDRSVKFTISQEQIVNIFDNELYFAFICRMKSDMDWQRSFIISRTDLIVMIGERKTPTTKGINFTILIDLNGGARARNKDIAIYESSRGFDKYFRTLL